MGTAGQSSEPVDLCEQDLQAFSAVSWLWERHLHVGCGTIAPEQETAWELSLFTSINELSACWIFLILLNVMKLDMLVYYLLAEL